MRVFVLSTGRCGSVTFAAACGHLTNWTAAHESLSRKSGPARFDYPDRHIEVDNRLSWFFGPLAERFDDDRTLYVHLRRDPEAVAQSYLRRWDNPNRASMIRAFAHGIVQRKRDWPEGERLEVCRAYVDTVTANIDAFCADRPSMTIWLERAEEQFPAFLERIGAEGDLDAAVAEWDTVHNSSPDRDQEARPAST
ncbi:hypothetical protein [Glycomyces xiaoerkulensis]|uniref:hypothetical protein n=1 Tax=Glycomyces xiaoerkulensis TaxID=2038139 RepID=UPI000C26673C|nr:hypothetical protein [Glycomyces xiaoerkulensis]